MVSRHSWFTCDTCSRDHATYEEARSCELDHIVDAAVERTREKISKAFRATPLDGGGG